MTFLMSGSCWPTASASTIWTSWSPMRPTISPSSASWSVLCAGLRAGDPRSEILPSSPAFIARSPRSLRCSGRSEQRPARSSRNLSRFLDAANRRPVDVTPVWLMRQAGRSLPEYRKLRERWSLLEIVAQPELCAEGTLQPGRRRGVNAAVMFADIMLPLRGMGVDFELVENVGPVLARPITSPEDVAGLVVPSGEEAAPQVITAVRYVVAQSPVPVIAFSGAPLTLASYLIEGRSSRDFAKVKAFMYLEPEAFDRLLAKLAATMAGYLKAQVAAGASAVQLFDSWAGALAVEDYEARVLPHTRAIFDELKSA